MTGRRIQPKRIHVYGSGRPALVDNDVFEQASSMAWHLSKTGYVKTNGANKRAYFLANLVLGVETNSKQRVHYINGDHLDCRRWNLVVLDVSTIMGTKKLHRNNTSGYKGVCWSKRQQKWVAYISPNGRRITLGSFKDKEEAARAYDAAALKYFGPLARTNAKMKEERGSGDDHNDASRPLTTNTRPH